MSQVNSCDREMEFALHFRLRQISLASGHVK